MELGELVLGGLSLGEDDRGRLHFWGEVFNLSEITQRWVRVTIRLLSEQGELLAELEDIAGLEWTMPGGRNPFHIRFMSPPDTWHHYEIRLSGHPHSYEDTSVPQPYAGLLVDKLHYREIERADLRCGIIGLLSNVGLAGATHVKVAGTLYGPDGRVVGVLSPYLVPRGTFRPGDYMPFELKYYVVDGLAANFSVQVQGRIKHQ